MPTGSLNLFGLHQYDNETSFFGDTTPFGQGIIVAYGCFFALLTVGLVFMDRWFGGAAYNSEDFNTAGRSIKTGLIAVDVVSHWTWSSTLLQSTYEVWAYGISGSYWYAGGATVNVLLFGILAIQIKRRAPKAHTVLELVRKRWGHLAAWTIGYICLVNNFFICFLLFLGAAESFAAVTGMSVYAACMLIPFSVIVYTCTGGLKATFTSSYIHTVIIYATLLIMAYRAYSSNVEELGHIRNIWQNLNVVAEAVPISGNRGGSAMTMWSSGGLQFGILNVLASFGNVWADQSYWQSAIAATPQAAYKGYIIGGLCWFAVPFVLATTLGLVALAADLPLSVDEATNGLVAVAAADFLLGKAGVCLILTILFMAVTSAGSAEFMAVGSLFTYDFWKVYIRPQAKGPELLLVSRIAVGVFGLTAGGLCCMLYAVNISVNFLFLIVGLLVSSAVPPLSLMLFWSRIPAGACIASTLGGQASAIIAWIVHTKIKYSPAMLTAAVQITIDSLQNLGPTLDGTIVSIVISAIILVAWTLLFPEKDPDIWEKFMGIEVMDKSTVRVWDPQEEHEMAMALKVTTVMASVFFIVFVFAWPLLTLPAGVFSYGYFYFWVVLSVIWGMVAAIVCTFMPLIESRSIILRVVGRCLCMGDRLEQKFGSKEHKQYMLPDQADLAAYKVEVDPVHAVMDPKLSVEHAVLPQQA